MKNDQTGYISKIKIYTEEVEQFAERNILNNRDSSLELIIVPLLYSTKDLNCLKSCLCDVCKNF